MPTWTMSKLPSCSMASMKTLQIAMSPMMFFCPSSRIIANWVLKRCQTPSEIQRRTDLMSCCIQACWIAMKAVFTLASSSAGSKPGLRPMNSAGREKLCDVAFVIDGIRLRPEVARTRLPPNQKKPPSTASAMMLKGKGSDQRIQNISSMMSPTPSLPLSKPPPAPPATAWTEPLAARSIVGGDRRRRKALRQVRGRLCRGLCMGAVLRVSHGRSSTAWPFMCATPRTALAT